MTYLEAEFINGDGADGPFLYKPEGVEFVGDGGMMCDEGRTLTANPFDRLCVVNASGDIIWAFLRSIDKLIGLLRNRLRDVPK